jgi:hypothetical protein
VALYLEMKMLPQQKIGMHFLPFRIKLDIDKLDKEKWQAKCILVTTFRLVDLVFCS